MLKWSIIKDANCNYVITCFDCVCSSIMQSSSLPQLGGGGIEAVKTEQFLTFSPGAAI